MSHKLNLVDFSQANIRTLHLTWFAFFLTFVMWFSHAPMKPLIMAAFDLSVPQWKALLILNVALTIPARIVIGILVDKFGPRTVYSTLLVISGVLCVGFAFAQSYEQLAIMRFAMGFAGAGFVIGIRMVGEWFPARQVGLAEGVYGGWGNFGSAAAAFTLPSLALIYGGDDGWRYAIATTGLIAMVYGVFFYLRARNTPKGSTYFKPKKIGWTGSYQPQRLLFLSGDEYSDVPDSRSAGVETVTRRCRPAESNHHLPVIRRTCCSRRNSVFADPEGQQRDARRWRP